MFSKQKIYCNVCGKEMMIEIPKAIGRHCKVCSLECLEEYELLLAKSIMDK